MVIHEFAHQLDMLDGSVDGTPPLESGRQAERWREVMTAEYGRLCGDLDRGRGTLLDEYAAENQTEFFAVTSERSSVCWPICCACTRGCTTCCATTMAWTRRGGEIRPQSDCVALSRRCSMASMEKVVRNVADIDTADRRALEHVIGKRLSETEQLIISIVNLDMTDRPAGPARQPRQSLDDWTHVYDGLSEEDIEAIDQIAKQRANLTRDVP